MLKLYITLTAATTLIRFDVPGPGTFYLYSVAPDDLHAATMEMAGYTDGDCVAVKQVDTCEGPCRLFFAYFEEETP